MLHRVKGRSAGGRAVIKEFPKGGLMTASVRGRSMRWLRGNLIPLFPITIKREGKLEGRGEMFPTTKDGPKAKESPAGAKRMGEHQRSRNPGARARPDRTTINIFRLGGGGLAGERKPPQGKIERSRIPILQRKMGGTSFSLRGEIP